MFHSHYPFILTSITIDDSHFEFQFTNSTRKCTISTFSRLSNKQLPENKQKTWREQNDHGATHPGPIFD